LAPFTTAWVGRPLADTVTPDTRHKIASLLHDVATAGLARRREVNLPSGERADIPMAYTALRLGPQGPTLAVGHDLRAVAQMQQRFMRVQQELERGYGLALRAAADGQGPKAGRAGSAPNPDAVDAAAGEQAEQAEQLNEASRAAFAAWLRAERLAAEGPVPAPAAGDANAARNPASDPASDPSSDPTSDPTPQPQTGARRR
jgi:hypothetical protein